MWTIARCERLLPVVLLALVLGCKTTGANKETTDGPPKISEVPKDADLAEHMADHYIRALDVQRAIIAGDLEGAREPATWIAEHATPRSMPKDWGPFTVAMQGAARKVNEAQTLEEAAQHAAEMGKVCGECHAATGAEVPIAAKLDPPKDKDPKSHMKRHHWAADRLWDGLTVPSNEAWEAGAYMLAEAPLHTIDTESEVMKIAEETHALGEKAVAEDNPNARAQILGQFLADCASCHTKLGVEPKL